MLYPAVSGVDVSSKSVVEKAEYGKGTKMAKNRVLAQS